MKKLQQQYIYVCAFFDARNIRERVLMGGLLIAVIINVWIMLLHDPLIAEHNKLNEQLVSVTRQIDTVNKQHAILTNAQRVDPDREIKQRLTIAQQHIDKLDQQLQQKMKGLIKPTQMAKILEQVLTQQTNMHFVRIQSLAAKPLLIPVNNKSANKAARPTANIQSATESSTQNSDIGVFQHGIEMEFTGSYLETLGYLKQLQQLPWNFYWDDVLFDVVDYPKSSIIIRVHTLSLKEGWIGV